MLIAFSCLLVSALASYFANRSLSFLEALVLAGIASSSGYFIFPVMAFLLTILYITVRVGVRYTKHL